MTPEDFAVSSFMDKLVDWRDFELFVRDLYSTGDVEVEHNVTMTGRSGAARQVDVLVRVKQPLHTMVIVIECKRWKDKVDRQRIDVLAASVRDLGAAKGALFTTTGYEPGAEAYARAEGIDIFVIRELKAPEWGAPGRVMQLRLETYAYSLGALAFPNVTAISLVEELPPALEVKVLLDRGRENPEELRLYSRSTGLPGPNLLELLIGSVSLAVSGFWASIPPLRENQEHHSLEIPTPIELDFDGFEFNRLRRPDALIILRELTVTARVHVRQSWIIFDRGAKLDLAVLVENQISKQRTLAIRDGNAQPVRMLPARDAPAVPPEDAVVNGSVLRVLCDPWVSPATTKADARGTVRPVRLLARQAQAHFDELRVKKKKATDGSSG